MGGKKNPGEKIAAAIWGKEGTKVERIWRIPRQHVDKREKVTPPTLIVED